MSRWALGIALSALACTTIEIEEREIFDAKKTVGPRHLEGMGFSHESLRLETPDGETLDAWFLEGKDSRGLVILFGGNGYLMVTARAWVEAFAELPVDVLMFDYRGYGESTGTPSVEGLRIDAMRVLEEATGPLGYPPERIVLHGHSLGSFAALFVAKRSTVAGVVLENPVTSAEDLVEGLVPWFLDPLVRFDLAEEIREDDNVRRVRRLELPLLVFGGGSDPIAPVRMARTLAEAGDRATLEVLDDGGHNDLATRPAYREAYRDFASKVLPAR